MANCPFRGDCHSLPAGMLRLVLREVGVLSVSSDWLRQTGPQWRLVGMVRGERKLPELMCVSHIFHHGLVHSFTFFPLFLCSYVLSFYYTHPHTNRTSSFGVCVAVRNCKIVFLSLGSRPFVWFSRHWVLARNK